MEDPTHTPMTLEAMEFSGFEEVPLAEVADRLGGAPTAVAGLESGLVFWGLSFFNPLLPKFPTES